MVTAGRATRAVAAEQGERRSGWLSRAPTVNAVTRPIMVARLMTGRRFDARAVLLMTAGLRLGFLPFSNICDAPRVYSQSLASSFLSFL
jgi:hypothetical protein